MDGIFCATDNGNFMLGFLFKYIFRKLFALLLFALTITHLRAELSDAAKIEFFDKKKLIRFSRRSVTNVTVAEISLKVSYV